MACRIWGLLVGINAYSAGVGPLAGCLSDIDDFHAWLQQSYPADTLHIRQLRDSAATRDNIIRGFRDHLGQAAAGDVAVFQFCGHGARSRSAAEFRALYPADKDEGLVCFDSRSPEGWDLADKELAVLIDELAARGAHVVVLLDCCHSGSGTRDADDFLQSRARFTHEQTRERPLESYLDGHYVDLRNRGVALRAPTGRHILLAACDREERAWEGRDRRGVFTRTLVETLSRSPGPLSYADLFVRCRQAIKKSTVAQTPQFETFGGFSAYSGFLGVPLEWTARRYSATCVAGQWQVACGAVHGLPPDSTSPIEWALYDDSQLAAVARTTRVGAQVSELEFDGPPPDSSRMYFAELTSLPVPPMAVFLAGDEQEVHEFQEAVEAQGGDAQSRSVLWLADPAIPTRFAVRVERRQTTIEWRGVGKLVQRAIGSPRAVAPHVLASLERIAAWERLAQLANPATRMTVDDVPLQFVEITDDGEHRPAASNQITFDVVRDEEAVEYLHGYLRAENRSAQPLYFLLAYFTDQFGIQQLYRDRIDPTCEPFAIPLDGSLDFHLTLDEDEGEEANHHFKLIVSTEPIDDFLLTQEGLVSELAVEEESSGRAAAESERAGAARGLQPGAPLRKRVHRREWFCRDVHLRLARRQGQIADRGPLALAGGLVEIGPHPAFRAQVHMGAVQASTRALHESSAAPLALARQGFELVNFGASRGEDVSVLELTNIQHESSLADAPLTLSLTLPLTEDECILPVTFDGEDLLLVGDPARDAQGKTRVEIRRLPEAVDLRRSLVKSLKLYFFKTILKRDDVNRLRWVQRHADGRLDRLGAGAADKTAAAKNILLVLHGIIGDTQNMAAALSGLAAVPQTSDAVVDAPFDLVLTYDYENLATPIGDTAIQLKTALEQLGLKADDGKRLTIVAHSMGGLVARWLIEREGGAAFVDRLIVCGTPNGGSPFGRVDGARQILTLLTTLALNAFPAYVPFGGAILTALNASKKLTPCLEQMSPSSEFLKSLNASPDPGVPYVLIAADARSFQESDGRLSARLVAKLGRGNLLETLFDGEPHDMATSVESVHQISAARKPAPERRTVVGHHMNYFDSAASLQVLAEVLPTAEQGAQ
ncbi:MAG: caspase family protein [Pirellulales bacterium]